MSTLDKLVVQRGKNNVTQRQMAKNLKCSPSTLNKYEKGNRKMTAEMQDMYVEFLGLELMIIVK